MVSRHAYPFHTTFYQCGAKQLLARYGNRLVCVRCWSDGRRWKQFKTEELIVAESDWRPTIPPLPVAAEEAWMSINPLQRMLTTFAPLRGKALGRAEHQWR